MDSLLATYASSDEEEDSSTFTGNSTKNPGPSSALSSLPTTKSSPSLSFSLPPPKSSSSNPHHPQTLTDPFSSNLNRPGQKREVDSPISDSKIGGDPAKSSTLFSALPQPKSSSLFSKLPEPKAQNLDSKVSANSSSSTNPKPKKVVQFRPPINPSFFKSNQDEDDDEDDEEEKRRKAKKIESLNHTPCVKSFLSSIPAPRNSSSLGALPNSSGTGRRSILEADVPASNSNPVSAVNEGLNSVNSSIGNYEHQSVDSSSANYTISDDSSNWGPASEHYANYDSYGGGYTSNSSSVSEVYANHSNNGSYASYGQYENNWGNASVSTDISPAVAPESLVKIPGKRGRTDIPHKIIEVNQDELIKNRPREDQTKLTGIAFGPSYQPVSTKGKPTKLHKRKHQIGSLYFDMRQKEMELAERRSKGFLTKAETQAKYGW